jgi:hypothetical protein
MRRETFLLRSIISQRVLKLEISSNLSPDPQGDKFTLNWYVSIAIDAENSQTVYIQLCENIKR